MRRSLAGLLIITAIALTLGACRQADAVRCQHLLIECELPPIVEYPGDPQPKRAS